MQEGKHGNREGQTQVLDSLCKVEHRLTAKSFQPIAFKNSFLFLSMPFINSAIDPATLPRAEALELQPVQQRYLRVLRIRLFITALVLALIAAALLYFIPKLRQPVGYSAMIGGWMLICGLYALGIEKGFPYKAYAVREKDVLFQKGCIFRSLTICPFNRIQNCSLQSGPIERQHGLASLVIYTAGSEGADLTIPGLLSEEADRLRQFILAQIHREDEGV